MKRNKISEKNPFLSISAVFAKVIDDELCQIIKG